MLKKLLMLCVALMLSVGVAFAAVDVNTADQASLEAVKGLGPVKSKAIIDERTANGPFKNADDLATRVKGLGTKSVANLEQEGLTIGGSSAPPTGAKATPRASSTSAQPKSTTKSSAAATAATSPAATTETTPAATPASGTKAKRASKKDAASAAAAASGASDAKPAKKSKKSKAASAAAASQ
jgi:competence ComEA-like helix-hairpin-helix protein